MALTKEAIRNGEADLATLALVANSPADVNGSGRIASRFGGFIRSVARVLVDMASTNPRGAWATSTAYALKDLVVQAGVTYIVTLAHTSGVFATDLGAGRLAVYQGALRSDTDLLDAKLRLLGVTTDGYQIPADGSTDATSALQTIISGSDCKILKRANPYIVKSTIIVPEGRTVFVQPNAKFNWQGPNNNGNGDIIPVFKLLKGSRLIVDGPKGARFFVECNQDQHMVYGAIGYGVDDVVISGLYGILCNHFSFEGYRENVSGNTVVYENVVTPAMKQAGDQRPLNVNTNIRVYGGGCRFNTTSTNWAGASMLWAFDWKVEDARWQRSGHGLVWLGGDANPLRHGAIANERKNADGYVINCRSDFVAVGGIWGTMGSDIVVSRCTVDTCGDVGLDAEGGVRNRFEDCVTKDGYNGCFTSFFFNRGLEFINCKGLTTNAQRPLFGVSNPSSTLDNRDIRFQGCTFVCTDPAGFGVLSFGQADSVRLFEVVDCKLVDCVIRAVSLNLNQVYICDNTFEFTRSFGNLFVVISYGGAQANVTRSKLLISGNRFLSDVLQPPGTHALIADMGDTNNTGTAYLQDNSIDIMLTDNKSAGVRFNSVGSNAGVGPSVWVERNKLNSSILYYTAPGSAAPKMYVRENRDFTDQIVQATALN